VKYTVWKDLSLRVEVEADSEEEAIDKMLDMDDTTFDVVDSDWGICL
jgi:hypothetical protein